jgi:predicted nucleotidyltransferase
MSKTKAKATQTQVAYWTDVILANVDAQSNDYAKSRKAYNECSFADYELGRALNGIADCVSVLSDDNASSIEKMRADRQSERLHVAATDWAAQLEAAMEIHSVFCTNKDYLYKPKNKLA